MIHRINQQKNEFLHCFMWKSNWIVTCGKLVEQLENIAGDYVRRFARFGTICTI